MGKFQNIFIFIFIFILPEIAKPENPTAKISAVIAKLVLVVLPTSVKNIASIPNPPQLNTFLTVVVVMVPDLRK